MRYPNLYVIGLTGNIATGKSTVAHMLEKEGAVLVDTDLIARQVVEPYMPGWQKILHHFGWEVLLPDLTLNRRKLGKIIFASAQKRALLGKLLHPYILEGVEGRLNQLSSKGKAEGCILPVVVIIPLLFEAGYESLVDTIWITIATPETQLKRLLERDNLTEEEALNRIRAQEKQEVKIPRCQVVINTEKPLQELRKDVLAEFKKIRPLLFT